MQGEAGVGSVDCQKYRSFCQEQGVNSYPTIRLYPHYSQGSRTYVWVLSRFFSGTVVILVSNSGQHSGLRFRFVNFLRGHRGWRDVDSLYSWAFKYLPSLVTQLNYQAFMDNVVDSEDPWIIDFYAPWCGHCIQFAPHYEKVAKVSQFGNNFVSIYIYIKNILVVYCSSISLCSGGGGRGEGVQYSKNSIRVR